jgi:hypothetical protein
MQATEVEALLAGLNTDVITQLARPQGLLQRLLQHEIGTKPRAVITSWHGGTGGSGSTSADIAGLLSPTAAHLYRQLAPLAVTASQQRVRGGAAYGTLLLSPTRPISVPTDAATLKGVVRAFRQQLRNLLTEAKPPVAGLAGCLPTFTAWRLFFSAHLPICLAAASGDSVDTVKAARDDLFALLVETLLSQSGPDVEGNVFCALAGLGTWRGAF